MKRKKTVLFVIIIIAVFIFSISISYGTDETNTGISENEENNNSSTENTNTESNNNENENTNTEIDNNNNEESGSTTSEDNNSGENFQNEETPVDLGNSNVDIPVIYYNPNSNNDSSKSNNANLKSLNLDIEGLSPEFSKNTTEYYLVVDLTVEEINVQAIAEDENATVIITGNKGLEEGQNTIQISVKSEDGTIKNYYIYVTKTDDLEGTNANLKTLVVKGWSFYPQFKTNIYSYSLTINEKVSKLDITAETENEEATFEIVGNENLEEGDNLIKIIVTAKDAQTSKEYKINTFISSKTVSIKQENKTKAFALMIILGIAIIITAIAIINKK